jgi:hypothetical protein
MSDQSMTQLGRVRPHNVAEMEQFDFEIFDGVRWISLNDHLNFVTGADSFSAVSQARQRWTAKSSMYDGEWEVHSVLSQVNETITIDILGADHIQVAENIMWLQEMFTQDVYTCRKTMDAMRETWRCFPAEWGLNRGQTMSHAIRAQMKLSIPRFPKAVYEAVE